MHAKRTRRCTRHHGPLMPECPSQWGCPAKALGMSALLCFYTHTHTKVERCTWGRLWDERARKHTDAKVQHEITSTHAWQMEIETHGVGRWSRGPCGTTSTRGRWEGGVRHRTSTSPAALVWAPPYLVLYEPCPSLQASCSSLINIRVFWLLQGCSWKKRWHHLQVKLLGFLTLISKDTFLRQYLSCHWNNFKVTLQSIYSR